MIQLEERNAEEVLICQHDHVVPPVPCSLAVLDPRVGHTTDVLSPFVHVLCHSD